ncbi:MAG TPA: sulfur carrier protein ThiS [Nitrospira sp.]|jgi:sulfur carrier protein|nr:sulfur carrier protein ThiS [Nitrospira sp.]HSC57717.1 sulfur carrier protein ThiS [Nitrospira sp.]
MQVKINGKAEDFPGGSILDLLKTKKIEPQMVAVEINDSMVDREHLASTQLKEGDRLEFLFYMGGGR